MTNANALQFHAQLSYYPQREYLSQLNEELVQQS